MIDEWDGYIADAAQDPTVKVVLLMGSGRAFCVGADADEMDARGKQDELTRKNFLWQHVHKIALTMERMDKPVIAAVNGLVRGAGADMALMCDIRIAGESTSFAWSYVNLNVIAGDGGTYCLPKIIGMPRALELFWTGRTVTSGANDCLGSGTWANATLGRALRLIAMNVGGAVPGEGAPSTHGFPGKLQMCCAENEAESPWEPLHVERGFARDISTATVVAAKGVWSFLTTTQDVDDLLKVFGNSMMSPAGGEYRTGGWPTLVLAPEHAQVFAKAGLSKADFKRRVWEASKMPASMMDPIYLAVAQMERRAELGEFTSDTLLPISA